jgi:hypothetical protein
MPVVPVLDPRADLEAGSLLDALAGGTDEQEET